MKRSIAILRKGEREKVVRRRQHIILLVNPCSTFDKNACHIRGCCHMERGVASLRKKMNFNEIDWEEEIT
jgi:hypothetical protein